MATVKKVVSKVKKAVTKVAKKKEKVVEVSVPEHCSVCGGKGLINPTTICTPCNGSGKL